MKVKSEIYCAQPTNLGLLGSLSVVSRESVRHPVITKLRPMSEFGRVTVTPKLGQLFWIMTDFQSESATTTEAKIEPATSSTVVH